MSLLQELRDATVTALIAAGVAEGNVKPARYRPIKGAELPMVAVYVRQDQMTALGDANHGHAQFGHQTTVAVEIATAAVGDEPGDDAILALIENCQDALFQSTTWMSVILGVEQVAIEVTHSEEGEARFIAARVDLTVSRRSQFEATIADDLAKVSGRAGDGRGVDFAEPDGTIEADFEVPIPTE